jgi:hypothetical protein
MEYSDKVCQEIRTLNLEPGTLNVEFLFSDNSRVGGF